MDMQQLFAAVQEVQSHLVNAQQELKNSEVEGTSGGGMVTARVNGEGELVDLTISAAVIDLADPAETAQTVADLVLAAVRDAYRAVAELQQEKMGPLSGLGGGMGQPGGLPGLPGLFGGAPGGAGNMGDAGTESSAGPGHPGA